MRVSRGNQLRHRARAEAGEMSGIVPRRDNLQNAQTIVAVSDKRKRATRDHADFHVVHVIQLAASVEHLIQLWRLWVFHVHDGNSLFACRDVCIGARDVNVTGILDVDKSVGDRLRLR